MPFSREVDFEDALVAALIRHGWHPEVLRGCTEADLLRNWANILFDNNRAVDRLGDAPLTEGEMAQILEQVRELRTPLRLNGFINGGSVSVVRDNPADALHFGKEVSLKIYDRREIAAGQSRYQIVRQPRFAARSPLLNDRRGDLMLLINGMPVFHVELKRSGVPVSQACHQIEKYAHEGVFSDLFSLVQIFVAMTPEETVYFANPGPDGTFNPDFYFHWADFYNKRVDDWNEIARLLLSIPMAHQMIGFYTVADASAGVLKVLRSYQYYAAGAISDTVTKMKWEGASQRGGYVAHTTGSGKTMTSFKSAQLIAASKDADKVVFLVDRIELGTQSLREYRAFAGEAEEVQATENTGVLIAKLKSDNASDALIVTSIQKMSNIEEGYGRLSADDIAKINSKRIVIIVDECHRSTFGDMMAVIKQTFPRAVFFGFTGTPIYDKNRKKDSTTETIFGKRLHLYSIADGIRDKNVLGFDPYKVLTFKDSDVRTAVALEKAKAATVAEALADAKKSAVFYEYMNLPMAKHVDAVSGESVMGIEDYLPNSQYETDAHKNMVVRDILDHWQVLSRGGKFHALFATSSIPEAIEYYRLLKREAPELKVTALFDPNIDNNGHGIVKEEGLSEIIADYNARYGQDFKIPTFAKMKKDISARLAHKRPYERIESSPEKEIDVLIVVDQMLTGFDSKWLNTLYLDKVLEYENVIQAFSRTNRLFGPDKPFGTIRYYRRPHTMERNIAEAVKLYAEDRPPALFVDRLNVNLEKMNFVFGQISDLFARAGCGDFSRLPGDVDERRKFARLFKDFNAYLEAAKVQGFRWDTRVYENTDAAKGELYRIEVAIDEKTYRVLALRYKELFASAPDPNGGGGGGDVPYDIDGHLTEIDTDTIDADYMNSRFVKFLKLFESEADAEILKQAEEELHKTFAALSQDEQKYAGIFLRDIQRGDVTPQEGKTFRDYITEYLARAKDEQIHTVAAAFGLDEEQLRALVRLHPTEANINEFGRFEALKKTVDKGKAREYFERAGGVRLSPPKVNIKVDTLLRDFIVRGGFDIA